MKKITFIMAVAASVLAIAPINNTHAFAKNKASKEVKGDNSNIAVKHFAADDKFVYLQISLLQNLEKAATVRITDDMGELLHVERFNSKAHSMLVKVNPDELNRVQLELSTAEGVYRKTIKIETKTFSTTVVEEVANN